jgi:hypothetical protein
VRPTRLYYTVIVETTDEFDQNQVSAHGHFRSWTLADRTAQMFRSWLHNHNFQHATAYIQIVRMPTLSAMRQIHEHITI